MNRLITLLILSFMCLTSAQAELKERDVSYQAGDKTLKGYIVYNDDFTGNRPGILVVHEWWGHNEYARERARMLAGMGYTALALDMYGDGQQAHHPEDASKFSGSVMQNMEVARARFLAAKDLLAKEPTVDATKIAAIGYCFGGAVVLEMARDGVDIAGVASFHGNLGTKNPAQPGKVKASVLVLNGEEDPFVTVEQITQFKQEMERANVSYQFISYPGAKHSFTNPDADTYGKEFNLPLEYNALADIKSWTAMTALFNELFKPN